MPIKIEPDVELDELTYSYCPGLLEHCDLNFAGIKYVNIKKLLERDRYEQCFKILIQEKPSPLQRPVDVTPKTLADRIMQIFQYLVEETDSSGKYKVEINKATGKSEQSIKSKHFMVSAPGTDNEVKDFVPSEMNQDLLGNQAHYTMMLHDHLLKMATALTAIVPSLMRQIELHRDSADKYSQAMVAMARDEKIYDLHIKTQQMEHQQAMIKQDVISKRNAQLIKILQDSGAVAKVSEALIKRVASATIIPSQEDQMEGVKVQKARHATASQSSPITKPYPQPAGHNPIPIESNQHSPSFSDSPNEITETVDFLEPTKEEMDALRAEHDDVMSKAPLWTYCSGLKITLQNNSEQQLYLKENLNDQVYIKLMNLLNSDSEDDAIQNLISLRDFVLPNPNYIQSLMGIKEVLTKSQNMIIDAIMMFKLPEQDED